MPPLRVLITGSRTWDRSDIVFDVLDNEYKLAVSEGKAMVLVHGDCLTGADRKATSWWGERTLQLEPNFHCRLETHPADWRTYGKSAGPIRNKQMVESGIDVVHAFWDGESRGTKHTIDLARGAGIPTTVHYYPGSDQGDPE